jgi:hypothetical protein
VHSSRGERRERGGLGWSAARHGTGAEGRVDDAIGPWAPGREMFLKATWNTRAGSEAKQSKAKQSKAKQKAAKQSTAKQSDAKQSATQHSTGQQAAAANKAWLRYEYL